MAVNLTLANNAIGSGVAFDMLDRIVYTGISERAIEDRIIRRFGGPSAMDRETAGYILYRYTLYRNAGQRIQNRNDNSTAGQQFLPNVPGCAGNFEYVVVTPFHDPANDRDFTKKFVISSDVQLGKQDILAQAGQLAMQFLAQPDYVAASVGGDEMTYQTGAARVTAAAKCTP